MRLGFKEGSLGRLGNKPGSQSLKMNAQDREAALEKTRAFDRGLVKEMDKNLITGEQGSSPSQAGPVARQQSGQRLALARNQDWSWSLAWGWATG